MAKKKTEEAPHTPAVVGTDFVLDEAQAILNSTHVITHAVTREDVLYAVTERGHLFRVPEGRRLIHVPIHWMHALCYNAREIHGGAWLLVDEPTYAKLEKLRQEEEGVTVKVREVLPELYAP